MDFEKYIFNTPRPTQPTRPVLTGKTPKDHRDYADKLEVYNEEMIEFKKELGAWYEAKDAMRDKFKQDLLIELGIANHPKADKVFEMAWDDRHDEGHEAVYEYASDLADLIRN